VAAAASDIVVNAVVNSASGVSGPVTAGEMVTIYGTGLGPASGALFSIDPTTNMVDTILAGTRVFFGSVAAPIT
jgi:uncharacterized protein (TIGR03437 family)